jgi:hypothetical protein
VDDRIDPFVPEQPDQRRRVLDVADHAACASQHSNRAEWHEIDDNDLVPAIEQLADRVGADVAGSARYEDAHGTQGSGGVIGA